MDAALFIAATLAGGAGAAARWLIDLAMTRRNRTRFPWGIWVVNVSGSFALGMVIGLFAPDPNLAPLVTIIGAGFLGGFTTFSTVAVATVTLAQARAWRIALVNIAGTFLACAAASAAGLACAALWVT